MVDLTNLEEIKALDPKDVFGSTGLLAKQCEQIWQDGESVVFPNEYKSVENIVICGMGGSAYGGHVVKELFKEELGLPLYINSDYTLPGFVNEKTLVIATSYSGSTEEPLTNAKGALEKGAKVIVFTNGGKLAELAKEKNLPAFIFDTTNNPSTQPRLGTGYIILGTIRLLERLGFLNITTDEIMSAVEELKTNSPHIMNEAMKDAKEIQNTIPVIFAGDFLIGNAHIMRNQANETAKTFSAFSELPELNHHLMEGLKNPTDKKLTILFLTSTMYPQVIQKRVALTKDVVQKNNVPQLDFAAVGTTKISQMLSTLSFGGYLTVYLAFLYGLDPSLIPWVDYFKEQLRESKKIFT
ncbi:MAG: bifunctional phosphoglucose/phosphomannose isomerase [Candidatus Levyibacteriota bacterium]